MRKRLVIRTLSVLLASASLFAAGSVQQSLQQLGGPTGKTWVLAAHWTGDATTGTVPATPGQIGQAGILQGYFLTSVETVPRTPAPTSGYGLTIKDQAGVDVLGGTAASLSATIPQAFSGSTSLPPINGTFTINITGQNVAGAKGDIYIYLQAPDTLIGAGGTGSPGSPGTPGTDGLTILNGSGAPSSGLGVTGDFYIDTVATRLYGPKAGSVWGSGVSLIGPTGSTGAAGAAGTDGLSILNGSGAPSGGLGVNGDFYIDTVASSLYGPKTMGAWGSGTSLIGPQGPPGSVITLGPLQFLQGKPDQTSPTQQAADLPYFLTSDYDFPSVTPGGSLTSSVLATITLTPCPLGVAGGDANHYYRIANGTGTAETVLGTGGSCTSGASTGTLMFTPANSHSGAWTFTSASNGAREAILASGGNARILLPSNATLSISGANGLVVDKSNLIISGGGFGSIIQARANENLNVLVNVTASDNSTFQNFSIDGNRSAAGTNPTFGTGIACGTAAVGGCSHVLMRSLQIFHNALFGVIVNDSSVDVEISRSYIHDNGGVTDATGNGTGIFIYWVAASSDVQTTGVRVIDNYISENHNTITNCNSGGGVAWYGSAVLVDGNYFLNNYNNGGQVVAAGHTGPGTISNNTIALTATGLVQGTSGIEIQTPDQTVSNNTITGHTKGWGIALEGDVTGPGGLGAGNTVITGNFIYNTFMSIGLINAGGFVRATTITGNRIWTSNPSGSSTVGIGLDSAAAATVITGNNFIDTPIPVQDNSTFGAYLSNNYPMAANLVYGGSVASATTVHLRCGQAALVGGSTTIQTIALPSDTDGTNGSGCHVSLIAAGGASWSTGTGGNISTALTPAVGTGIELVNTAGEWNPVGGASGGSLPTTTSLQYLRGNEYTGSLEAVAFPFIIVADYNYTPQLPGGTISIGSNTKTLTPCPLGMDGSDANHSIYISGGTGTAEAVLIGGGTCTSGAASGTIVFNAANTHSGAYSIRSASSGMEEAVNALPAAGGTIYMGVGTFIMRREVILAKANVIIQGAGMSATILQRSFTTNPSNLLTLSGAQMWVKDLTLDGNDQATNGEELSFQSTDGGAERVKIINNAQAAIDVLASRNTIKNCYLLGQANASVVHGAYGIWSDLGATVNGLLIDGNTIKDQTLNGIFVSGLNIRIVNNYLKGNHVQSVPTGGGQIDIKDNAANYNIVVANNTIDTGGGVGTDGIEEDSRNTTLIGNVINDQLGWGIAISNNSGTPGPTHVSVIGNTIRNGGADGIIVAADVTDWSITDNRINGSALTSINILAGGGDHYFIVNNDLRSNTSPMFNGATGSDRVITGNLPSTENGVAFSTLGTPSDGTILYCNNCTIANPCAGASSGALAKRLNGVWVCN